MRFKKVKIFQNERNETLNMFFRNHHIQEF